MIEDLQQAADRMPLARPEYFLQFSMDVIPGELGGLGIGPRGRTPAAGADVRDVDRRTASYGIEPVMRIGVDGDSDVGT